MLRDDFDLRLTNELIETYLKIAYGIKPGCWLDAEMCIRDSIPIAMSFVRNLLL